MDRDMELRTCLERLCGAPGAAGLTGAAETAAAMLKEYIEDVRVDALGSVMGIRRCGLDGAPLLLLEAHIDEIGFVVTRVYDDGFVYTEACGGVDRRAVTGARVTLWGEKPVGGLFVSTPPHLAGQDADKLPEIASLGIDTGLDARHARRLLPPGTRATFAAEFTDLAGGRVCSKALDDRAGVAAVLWCLELLRDGPLACDLAVAFCVQEELGTRGAGTAAFGLAPDAALAVDVSFARTPDADPDKCGVMGKGPMIGWSPCLDAGISRRLTALSGKRGIPSQAEVMGGDTGTDADAIASVRTGVPAGLVSIPLKYMHTPTEVVQLSDVEDVGRLLAAYVQDMDGEGSRL